MLRGGVEGWQVLHPSSVLFAVHRQVCLPKKLRPFLNLIKSKFKLVLTITEISYWCLSWPFLPSFLFPLVNTILKCERSEFLSSAFSFLPVPN